MSNRLTVVIGATSFQTSDAYRWRLIDENFLGVGFTYGEAKLNAERFFTEKKTHGSMCSMDTVQIAMETWDLDFWITRLPNALLRENRPIHLFIDRGTIRHMFDSCDVSPFVSWMDCDNSKQFLDIQDLTRKMQATVLTDFCAKLGNSVTVYIGREETEKESESFFNDLLAAKNHWHPHRSTLLQLSELSQLSEPIQFDNWNNCGQPDCVYNPSRL
jgi:hypothetical protein